MFKDRIMFIRVFIFILGFLIFCLPGCSSGKVDSGNVSFEKIASNDVSIGSVIVSEWQDLGNGWEEKTVTVGNISYIKEPSLPHYSDEVGRFQSIAYSSWGQNDELSISLFLGDRVGMVYSGGWLINIQTGEQGKIDLDSYCPTYPNLLEEIVQEFKQGNVGVLYEKAGEVYVLSIYNGTIQAYDRKNGTLLGEKTLLIPIGHQEQNIRERPLWALSKVSDNNVWLLFYSEEKDLFEVCVVPLQDMLNKRIRKIQSRTFFAFGRDEVSFIDMSGSVNVCFFSGGFFYSDRSDRSLNFVDYATKTKTLIKRFGKMCPDEEIAKTHGDCFLCPDVSQDGTVAIVDPCRPLEVFLYKKKRAL